MRRCERASTLLTSIDPSRPGEKLLGDTVAVLALLDRLLHHAHVLQCGPRSWRTRAERQALGSATVGRDPGKLRAGSSCESSTHSTAEPGESSPAAGRLRIELRQA